MIILSQCIQRELTHRRSFTFFLKSQVYIYTYVQ